MLQIQLYIEGQEVELYKDESVTLTRSIQDVRDIKKIFTDFSRTFNVPASKNNNKIFKHFHNFLVEGFDARTKKDAEILLNYKPFKKGKIKLEGATLKNNEARSYKITFFGSTVVLPDLLGEDRLASLSELQAFDFRYNDTNIQAYMTNGLDNNIGSTQINDAVIFPLITHTNRLIYDSSLDQTYNLYDSGSSNGVPFTELKPALRVDAIIRAIELHYDIEFSDDFFAPDNEAYYNLYLWLHTKAGGLFVDQDKAQQFTRINLTSGTQKEIDELVVRSNNFRLNNADPKIEFRLRFQVTPALSNLEYNVVVHRNGQEFKRFEGLTGETKNGKPSADYNTVDDAIIVDSGEFSVFVETADATTFDLFVVVVRDNLRFISSGQKTNTLEATLETFTDTNLSITRQLPDMKVIDFLTGLFTMFNLTAYVKDDGTIVVQTLDDFYASSTETFNLTEYVITDESQIDSTIPYKQVNLGYKGLNTFLAKNFQKQNNKGWGTLEYQSQAKFEGKIYTIELPFEHLLYERLNDADTGTLTNIQWGWHTDEKQEANDEEPVLFYPIKAASGSIAARNIANTQVSISSPYMPSNSESIWSGSGLDNMSQSINFHAEVDEYVRVPNEKTLFKTYYEDYIKDLFDPSKRITKISAYLPLRISRKIRLADTVIIFNKAYRINTITTNFETNKSDLELTNIIGARVIGTTIVTPPAEPTDTQCATTEVDLSSDELTADSTVYRASRGLVTADGFVSPSIIDPVNDNIEGNQHPAACAEPNEVTAAIINLGYAQNFTDNINFKFEIIQSGTINGVNSIDEYGFLVASDEAYLNASNNIDTLKADSNITVVNVVRATGQPTLTTGSKNTIVSGLTHPATRYVRFYVRTNIDEINAKADVISNVVTGSTIATANTSSTAFWAVTAGAGSFTGYDTEPTTYDDIKAKSYIAPNAGLCGFTVNMDTQWYHNGTQPYPVVGDYIKEIDSADFTGGSNSFSTIAPSAGGVGDYFVLGVGSNYAVGDDTIGANIGYLDPSITGQRQITNYIVIEYATGEVLSSIRCDLALCEGYKSIYYEIGGHTNPYLRGLTQDNNVVIWEAEWSNWTIYYDNIAQNKYPQGQYLPKTKANELYIVFSNGTETKEEFELRSNRADILDTLDNFDYVRVDYSNVDQYYFEDDFKKARPYSTFNEEIFEDGEPNLVPFTSNTYTNVNPLDVGLIKPSLPFTVRVDHTSSGVDVSNLHARYIFALCGEFTYGTSNQIVTAKVQ